LSAVVDVSAWARAKVPPNEAPNEPGLDTGFPLNEPVLVCFGEPGSFSFGGDASEVCWRGFCDATDFRGEEKEAAFCRRGEEKEEASCRD